MRKAVMVLLVTVMMVTAVSGVAQASPTDPPPSTPPHPSEFDEEISRSFLTPQKWCPYNTRVGMKVWIKPFPPYQQDWFTIVYSEFRVFTMLPDGTANQGWYENNTYDKSYQVNGRNVWFYRGPDVKSYHQRGIKRSVRLWIRWDHINNLITTWDVWPQWYCHPIDSPIDEGA